MPTGSPYRRRDSDPPTPIPGDFFPSDVLRIGHRADTGNVHFCMDEALALTAALPFLGYWVTRLRVFFKRVLPGGRKGNQDG